VRQLPCLAALLLAATAAPASEPLALRYDEPARVWTEALPVGNGRLGAMVFGGVSTERLQLNESTLWSGGPRDGTNPAAREALPEVRAAIFAGDFVKATELTKKLQGPFTQAYQPLGNLRLRFRGEAAGPARDYERRLDLERAVVTTTYRVGRVTYTRDVWSSAPDQAIVVRLSCDRPGRLSLEVELDSPQRHAVETDGEDTLVLRGRAPSHAEPNYRGSPRPFVYEEGPDRVGLRFEARVRARVQGGRVFGGGSTLSIEKADAVILILAAATNFAGPLTAPGRSPRDAGALAREALFAAADRTDSALLARHVADHQALFGRVTLDLGSAPGASELTTDTRLRRFAEGAFDPGLATLLYQYGRYLLIASSRPGGLPANLQGIWNESMSPPWSSNYTININTEMNYWPAEVAGLAECHRPLLDFVGFLVESGRRTAQANYGARGFVAHHNSDAWAHTAAVGDFGQGDPMWANWPMGGAWLATHAWEHFSHGRDEAFLRERGWPILKAASEFGLDWLIEDGQGHLVTAPSTSPELGFHAPGGTASVSMASTMDMSILWEVFTDTIEAARVLGIDADFAKRLEAARARLYPMKIGTRGQLQEWFQDFIETDVHHRHPSHLFGVYPGRRLTPAQPALWTAARRALEIRGDDGTGWSLGWKVNLWARFRDGDRAYRLVMNLLRPVFEDGRISYGPGGGVYPNLFDAHPPFQIDGNFAFTSGVSEMLLQSRLNVGPADRLSSEIDLLPALPSAWPAGSVRGLRARGAIEVAELSWTAGQLRGVRLVATRGGPLRVRCARDTYTTEARPGQEIALDGRLRPHSARPSSSRAYGPR
jgi:alpha-L-fucosidase 2